MKGIRRITISNPSPHDLPLPDGRMVPAGGSVEVDSALPLKRSAVHRAWIAAGLLTYEGAVRLSTDELAARQRWQSSPLWGVVGRTALELTAAIDAARRYGLDVSEGSFIAECQDAAHHGFRNAEAAWLAGDLGRGADFVAWAAICVGLAMRDDAALRKGLLRNIGSAGGKVSGKRKQADAKTGHDKWIAYARSLSGEKPHKLTSLVANHYGVTTTAVRPVLQDADLVPKKKRK